MSKLQWTGTGATAEKAVEKGLKKLGLTRDQVEIKVLGEKKSGLFSLFGFRRMEVTITEKPGRRFEREDHWDREHRRDDFRGGRDRDRGGRGRDRDDRGGRRDEFRGRDDRGHRDENRRDDRGPRRDDRGGRRDDSHGRDRNDRGPRDDNRRNDRGPRRDEGRRDEPRRDEPRRDRRDDRGPRREESRRDDRGFNNERPRRDEPRRDQAPREDAPQRPAAEVPSADVLLNQWKSLLGWESLAWSPKNGENGDVTLVLDAASGEKLGSELVECLQHLLNVVRAKSDRSAPRVFLEIEGQAAMDEQGIIDEAHRAAEEVKRTGQPFRMDPMDSRDRRLVHQALADHPDVETASEGEGPWRKVVVRPKRVGRAAALRARSRPHRRPRVPRRRRPPRSSSLPFPPPRRDP
jgi:predicted RNA-binding protein Jag